MKLLLINSYYPPHCLGGYELRCKDVVDSLKRRGHEILIITSRCPDPKCNIHINEGTICRVLHQKSETTNVFKQILNDCHDLNLIKQMSTKFDPDIIYLWNTDNLSSTIYPFFSNIKKQIVIDDGSSEFLFLSDILNKGIYFDKDKRDSRIKKWLKCSINFYAYLISLGLVKIKWTWPYNYVTGYFNSSSSREYAQDGGALVENTKVIYSGIDVSRFPYTTRENFGEPITIITPGRIHPKKGTKDSLLLLNELMKININIRLKIVGKDQSRSYFNEIISSAKEMGISEAVEYLPIMSQAELTHLYQESDFCFFPSYQKYGLSRVPLEAMASGCIVITYGNEGSKEIIQDQETGFIVSEGNVIDAATLISKLIDQPEHYKLIKQKARLQIEHAHTLEHYIDQIENLLNESLLKSKE